MKVESTLVADSARHIVLDAARPLTGAAPDGRSSNVHVHLFAVPQPADAYFAPMRPVHAFETMRGHPNYEQLVLDIRQQLREIFSLISRIEGFANGGAEWPAFVEFVDRIVDCVQANFAAEEYVLTLSKDRRRGAQRVVHQRIIDELLRVRDAMSAPQRPTETEIRHALDFLVVHYLNDDPFFPSSTA